MIGGDGLLSFNSKLAVLVSGADVWIKKVRHAHLILVNPPPATSRQPVSFCVTATITATCLCSVHRWVPPLAPLDLYSCFQASSRHRKAYKVSDFREKNDKNNTGGGLGLVYFELNAKNGGIECPVEPQAVVSSLDWDMCSCLDLCDTGTHMVEDRQVYMCVRLHQAWRFMFFFRE